MTVLMINQWRAAAPRGGGSPAAPRTLTFCPVGSRYPPPAAGPLDTDIRSGFEFPRTIEPAWRLILRERAGRERAVRIRFKLQSSHEGRGNQRWLSARS